MTSVQDFMGGDAPNRLRSPSHTWSPHYTHGHSHSHSPNNTRQHHGHTSPPGRDSPELDRRGSVASRVSSGTMDYHLRHRKLSRADTVKTYHEPEANHFETPGAEPGVDINVEDEKLPPHLAELKAQCTIKVIDFGDHGFQIMPGDNEGIHELLTIPRPEGRSCRWISVNGLSYDVIKAIGRQYKLHRLAVEDLIHTHSRTKVDWYRDHAYVVLTLQKLVRLHQHDGNQTCPAHEQDSDSEFSEKKPAGKRSWRQWFKPQPKRNDVLPRYLDRNGDGFIDETVMAHSTTDEQSPIKNIRTLHRYESSQLAEHTAFMEKHSALASEDLVVSVEQVSMFLMPDNTIISFFEHSAEDIEMPMILRLDSPETVLRQACDASLMLQAIIDAIVDLAMPVRDAYNKARKELQIDAMTSPDTRTSRALHIFGEEIDMLQNLIKPIVHLVNALRDHNSEPATTATGDFIPPSNQQQVPQAQRISPTPSDTASVNGNTSSDENLKPENLKLENKHLTQTKRTRQGSPMYERSISDFSRRAPAAHQRSLTPTPTNHSTATTLKPTVSQPTAPVKISPLAHTYFGDVLDHTITMIQAMEQMDASAQNISTLIFNTVGAKTNNFMMILALVTVVFAPLTVVSGYFGMNFSKGSGLDHPFHFFFVVAIPVTVGSLACVGLGMCWDEVSDWIAKRARMRRKRGRRAARRRRM